jgi:hypothetical protein
MKACRESRGIPPLILYLVSRQRWVVKLTPRSLHCRERMPVFWLGGWAVPRARLNVLEKRQPLVPARVGASDRPACSLVAIPTELSRFSTQIDKAMRKNKLEM